MEPFIGTIEFFGFNFVPRYYYACNGQLLSIAQNQALFALLGTQFGGNGIQTFALPNLQGCVPIGQGPTPEGSLRQIGQLVGVEKYALSVQNMPMHTHNIGGAIVQGCNPDSADSDSPENTVPAASGASMYASASSGAMAATTVNLSTAFIGSDVPVNNMQPSLVLNACIASQGIFPSRQ
jgi:microcystin-dependent protein